LSCRVHNKLHVLMSRKTFYQTDMLLVCISDEIALIRGARQGVLIAGGLDAGHPHALPFSARSFKALNEPRMILGAGFGLLRMNSHKRTRAASRAMTKPEGRSERNRSMV